MKGIAKKVRSAYYTALNGNVMYNGSAVPVSDGFNTLGDWKDRHIIIVDVTESNRDTLDTHITEAIVNMQIVSKQYNAFSHDIVDDIEDAMLQILIPTIKSNGLTAQTGLQITNVRNLGSPGYIDEAGDNGNISRKPIRISQYVIQN